MSSSRRGSQTPWKNGTHERQPGGKMPGAHTVQNDTATKRKPDSANT
jgi:hypothetical protein